MSQFNLSYKKLTEAEFSDKPEKFLHKNPNESHLTIGGIYGRFHQLAVNWHFVKGTVALCDGDIKRASVMLYADKQTRKSVYEFFEKEFWQRMKLDYVQDQKICDEMFLFGVHAGVRKSIEIAQEVVGTKVDGIVGQFTLKALNNYHGDFAQLFTQKEKDYYNTIIEDNPKLAYAEKGFMARAEIVS